MKIKVGEYVRIKHMYNEQKIAKIKAILDKDACYHNMQMYRIDVIHQKSNGHFASHEIYEEDIIKHSKNIIDLIEVGDYVNGCLIVEINKDPFIKGQINLWTNMLLSEGEPFPNEYYKAKILGKDIKTVVTKEQFANTEYKLED